MRIANILALAALGAVIAVGLCVLGTRSRGRRQPLSDQTKRLTGIEAQPTLQPDQHALPPIILYDNVPGGAGLVARLEREEVLKNCLQAALKRVEGACGCAPNTSCYGCLRSYRNQFAHQILQRGPVQQYLASVLSAWDACIAPKVPS